MICTEDTAIDLVVRKVFFAFEDDRLATIHHFSGPEGVKNLTVFIVNQEKMSSEIVDLVYDRVMEILDNIAINPDSVTSRTYRMLYGQDVQRRLSTMGY